MATKTPNGAVKVYLWTIWCAHEDRQTRSGANGRVGIDRCRIPSGASTPLHSEKTF
ncbi:hypothetical protein RMSM_03561 [Rhodopirellula maiorica SM1]|uniref:Uncharacterized protein n=1 Tax=Rhodopirellula maiorica SM1 TaxID=1265738 RepID=M5RJP9_9BACT|nr:hypothetical protein RMSM_03561 [Rhodopirellula maiorica SM1]